VRLLAAAAVLLALPFAGAADAAPAKAPVAVGVSQREFRISTYRRTVPAGPVRFNVRNFGEDTHNLVITGPRGYLLNGPDLGSGDRMTVEASLRRAGTYKLICTRADHASRGMWTRIKVRARR
jgi:hypothetical protein